MYLSSASAPVAPGRVGFVGSRSLPSRAAPGGLVVSVVGSVLAAGRDVGVGCASGADSAAISAVLARGSAVAAARLSVFCAFGPAPRFVGSWRFSGLPAVRAAVRAGAFVVPWAGAASADAAWGGSHRLVARLARRSRALVAWAAAGGSGSGVVAFVAAPPPRPVRVGRSWSACGSGSWSSVALAAGFGLPVVVFPVGCSGGVLPAWPGGSWRRAAASGVWARGWRWVPAQGRLPGL